MKLITLDGRIVTRESLHEVLARELNFPNWYGRNLDALYDCLGDLFVETRIELVHWSSEGWQAAVLQVMQDAAAENSRLHIDLADEPGELRSLL